MRCIRRWRRSVKWKRKEEAENLIAREVTSTIQESNREEPFP